MEDVLEVYARPYDPARPVVCLDESSRQLVAHSREPLPMRPGDPLTRDYEYVRRGVADVFMVFEPLACVRRVLVRARRTRVEFAEALRFVSDVMYPEADAIVLVMDNLNTHTTGSLYEAFPPEEARRLAERFEIHYTPKHGSWLDMAEVEIGVLMNHGLPGRVGSLEEMARLAKAWEDDRNARQRTVDWQFTTADARVKLRRLYPQYIA